MAINTLINAGGVGLALYGLYNYRNANQLPQDEQVRQKEVAMACMILGLSIIYVNMAFEVSSGTNPVVNIVKKAITETTPQALQPVITDIETVADCPIKELKEILDQRGPSSLVTRAFRVLKETQGISCENFLPWQDKFSPGDYIDGIKESYLSKSAEWGIDRWKRSFIAMKYVCDGTMRGAVTLFQRYTEGGPFLPAGHYEAEGCYPNLRVILDYDNPDRFLEKLRTLLDNKFIETVGSYGTSSITLADKLVRNVLFVQNTNESFAR